MTDADDKGKPGNRPRLLSVREVVEETVNEAAGDRLLRAIRWAQEHARQRKAREAKQHEQPNDNAA